MAVEEVETDLAELAKAMKDFLETIEFVDTDYKPGDMPDVDDDDEE